MSDDSKTPTAGANWLIWSNEHRAWWRPNSAGYTSSEAQAGRYTFEGARSISRLGGEPRGWTKKAGPYEVMVPAPEALPMLGAVAALYEALETLLREAVKHLPIDHPNGPCDKAITAAGAALSLARGETDNG